MQNNGANTSVLDTVASPFKNPSMSSLIFWNISKALEKNPHMNLQNSLEAAQDSLEWNARDLSTTNCQSPEEQHLVCAVLAWQQLGHEDAYSLYEFIQAQKQRNLYIDDTHNVNSRNHPKTLIFPSNTLNIAKNDFNCLGVNSYSFMSLSKGPVVKLPMERNIVMRLENASLCQGNKKQPLDSKTTKKIEAACCMDSACTERLTAMGTATAELRARVAKLARREAERAEVLERAEAAWGDLELGYQRRLAFAEEKEDDIRRQIKKAIEDRNVDKNACTALAKQLKEAGDAAEKEQTKLKEVEKELCCRACFRLKLSEEVARGEAIIADLQCKLIQLDRDLQFKEEHARRKLVTIENETESARVLTHEAERVLRAELSGLRQQIEQVSAQLLEEDSENNRIKTELDQLRQEKMELVEDLDGCKSMCDSKMQAKLDELKEKRKQVEQLKEKVIDCQCKVPVDTAVTVKRTPSLAALCSCAPEDRLLESCSCTSLRDRLISNLLAELFGGLQSEMVGGVSQMPCELLKCLEDKHNWDRSSVVKSKLRNFFSKLLVGELDIAIATSIENYHAKWVGSSCADETKMTPDSKDDLKEGWEQRALERRAQKLATKLAEQLFEERAEELTKRAKEIVTSGPPPCECKKEKSARVLTCLTDTKTPFGVQSKNLKSQNQTSNQTQIGLARARQDVKELKLQIEKLKKESIKKDDLKLMEEKFAEIIKQTVVQENENYVTKDNQNCPLESSKKVTRVMPPCKPGCTKRRVSIDTNYMKKNVVYEKPTKQTKKYNHHQSYAVNLCLCDPIKANKILQNSPLNTDINVKPSAKAKPSKEIITKTSHIRQTEIGDIDNNSSAAPYSGNKYKCFHEVPSTTSLDKLLKMLTKWKYDLGNPQENIINYTKSTTVSKSFLDTNTKNIFEYTAKNVSKVSCLVSNEIKLDNDPKIRNDMANDINVDEKVSLHDYHQTANTPSVYMAAVNLDKNNEIGYEYANTTDLQNKGERNKNNKSILKGQTCEFKNSEYLHKLTAKDIKKVKVLNEHLYGKANHITNLKILTNTKNIRNVKSEVIMINSESKEIANQKYVSDKVNETQLILNKIHQNYVIQKETNEEDISWSTTNRINIVPNNTHQTDLLMTKMNQTATSQKSFDYYIKFLGVTLTNLDSQEQGPQEQKSIRSKNKMPKIKSEVPAKKLRIDTDLPYKEAKNKYHVNFDKLKSNINNTFSNLQKSNSLQQIADACHSRNLKYLDNNIEQCVCCNTHKNDSKDLEENVFHLLKDYLKEKLREFKLCACEGTYILPEEEEKIFASILTRVKQVISNYTNEMKRNKPEGTWQRAYGLLREYLKVKIERAQGIPLLNKSNDVFLPEILEKVCDLIENDFQRLKLMCKCEDNNKVAKNILNKDLLGSKELLEKDTIFSMKKYVNSIFQIFKQNSTKPIANKQSTSCQISPNLWMETKSCEAIVRTNSTLIREQSKRNFMKSLIFRQSVSAQVAHNLGTATKSCNIMKIDNRNKQTSDTMYNPSNKESQETVANYFDCYRGPKSEECSSEVLKLCRNKEILLNLYADVLVNCDIIGRSRQIKKQNLKIGFINSLPNLNNILNYKNYSKLSKQFGNNSRTPPLHKSYHDCTVRCTCNEDICACLYTSSITQNIDYNMNNNWQELRVNVNNNQPNLSCAMKSSKNENVISNHDRLTDISEYLKELTDSIDLYITDVKNSKMNLNTYEEISKLGTDADTERLAEWFECPALIPNQLKSSNKNLINPLDVPHLTLKKSSKTVTDTEILSRK